jgi:hypothetical protein
VAKVYQVFIKPNLNIPGQANYDSTKLDYSILSQQVVIKYEGSM